MKEAREKFINLQWHHFSLSRKQLHLAKMTAKRKGMQKEKKITKRANRTEWTIWKSKENGIKMKEAKQTDHVVEGGAIEERTSGFVEGRWEPAKSQSHGHFCFSLSRCKMLFCFFFVCCMIMVMAMRVSFFLFSFFFFGGWSKIFCLKIMALSFPLWTGLSFVPCLCLYFFPTKICLQTEVNSSSFALTHLQRTHQI